MAINSTPYETVPINNDSNPTKQKKSKWGSMCVTLALAINTLLLVGILVAIVGVRHRVDDTLVKVDEVIAAVESGKPTEQMLDFTNKVFSSAAGYFFLGSFNGTVSGYVQNILRYDFSGFANDYIGFADKVAPQFTNAQDSVSQGILTVMNAIKSIAGEVAKFQNVQANAATNAAMSDGIFRLDHMLDFVRAQASAGDWKDAAEVCNSFSAQIKTMTWQGTYIDGEGMQRNWDITSTVNDVTSRMDNVCGKLAQIIV